MRFPFGRRGRLATLAAALLLLTAGGIAYATIPDAGGVIHGCYKNSNGALRVIDTGAGATCSAAETALAWNQTGPPGSGATTFTTTVAADTDVALASLDNGITVTGICNSGGGGRVQLEISVTGGATNTLQLSGTTFNADANTGLGGGNNEYDSTHIHQLEANNDAGAFTTIGAAQTEIDALARNSINAGNKFARIDIHGSVGSPCTFWGMIIPSA
jgi:hypothetical protein